MITVAPGRLRLDDGRVLQVREPFALGQYAVSFDEFDHYGAAAGLRRGGDAGWGRGTLPVIDISWFQACSFVQWLTASTGRPYRVPSADEWEYAARAGVTGRVPGPHTVDCADANCLETPGYGTFPVSSLEPNSWGFSNMLGNVAEWAWQTAQPLTLVGCGGHWATPSADLAFERREALAPGARSNRIGLRVAAAV